MIDNIYIYSCDFFNTFVLFRKKKKNTFYVGGGNKNRTHKHRSWISSIHSSPNIFAASTSRDTTRHDATQYRYRDQPVCDRKKRECIHRCHQNISSRFTLFFHGIYITLLPSSTSSRTRRTRTTRLLLWSKQESSKQQLILSCHPLNLLLHHLPWGYLLSLQ